MTHPNVRAQCCEHVTHSVRKSWVHVVKSSVMAHSLFLVTRLHCTGFPDCWPLAPCLFSGLAFVSQTHPRVSSGFFPSHLNWVHLPLFPPTRKASGELRANLWEECFQPGPNTYFKQLCSSSIPTLHTHYSTYLFFKFPQLSCDLCIWRPDNSHFDFSFLYQSSSSCRNYLSH